MNAFCLPIRVLTLVAALTCIACSRAQSVPTLDPNFKPAITRDGGIVSAVAAQPDGKVIVAGGFNAINGVARNGLARLNGDGSVDPSFNPGVGVCCGSGTGPTDLSGSISAIAIQKDGKIVLGGSFSAIEGTPRQGLARLNADGTLDTTFDPGPGLGAGQGSPGSPVGAIVVQPDGKLLVGGSFISVNGVPRNGVARLNPDGSVDTGFDPGSGLVDTLTTSGRAAALVLLGNGQVLVAGSFQLLNGYGRFSIGRLNTNGSVDQNFTPYLPRLQSGVFESISIDGLAVQTDGNIMVSGTFDTADSEIRNGLARLNKADGTVDTSFNPSIDSLNGESYTVLGLQADNRLIALRQFSGNRAIVRLNLDGSLDTTFSMVLLAAGGGGSLQVSSVAALPNRQWLVGGNLSAGTTPLHQAMALINADGGLDDAFNPRLEVAEGSASHVLAVAVQKDGKVLVGGTFQRVDGTGRNRLARLNHDGTLDGSFTPAVEVGNLPGYVSEILVQDDGNVLIGGLFTTVNGFNRNSIARLNQDGSLDASFDVGSGTSAPDQSIGKVSALALQPDDSVIVAGDFTQFNGVSLPWLGRLNTNGSVDTGFIPPLWHCPDCSPPDIRDIVVLSDGKIVIGGTFNRVEILLVNGLARLFPDGTADSTFLPPIPADQAVSGLALGSNDTVVVVFTIPDPAGGPNHGRLLRFNADGSQDPGYKPDDVIGDGSSETPISALAFDPEGRLVFGGQFTSVGNTPRRGLARLNSDGTLDLTFDAGAGFGQGIFESPSNIRARVTGIGLQDDGGIVVGGNFAVANDQPRLGLARFQAETPSQPGRPVIRSWARAADGTFSFTISGEVGRTYRVQGSSDPRGVWTDLKNVTGAATPQLFADTDSKSLARRFYRVVGQ